jgi:hypothetical protein
MKCNTLDVRYRSEDYQPAQAQAEGAHHRAGAGPFALDGKPRTQAQCKLDTISFFKIRAGIFRQSYQRYA